MSFPRAKITRFNDGAGCAPGVGTYNPVVIDKVPSTKFEKSDRFRDGSTSFASCPSTPAGSFQIPRTPVRRDKLGSKIAELLQQLEDRDRLVAQLRLAKNQLSTKVAQLEAVLRSTQKGRRFKPSGAAAASSSVRSAPRDAALQEPDPPQDPEVRLTKGTEELRAELAEFINELGEDQASQEEQNQMELLTAKEGLQQVSGELSSLKLEKESILEQMMQLQQQVSALKEQQSALSKGKVEAEHSLARLEEAFSIEEQKALEAQQKLSHLEIVHSQLEAALESLLESGASLGFNSDWSENADKDGLDHLDTETACLEVHEQICDLVEWLHSVGEERDNRLAEISTLGADLALVTSHRDSLEDKLASLSSEKTMLEGKLSSAVKKVEDLSADKELLNNCVASLEDKVMQLEEQLTSATTVAGHLLEGKQGLEVDLASLQAEHLQLQERMSSTQAQLGCTLAKVEQLEEDKTTLDADRWALKKQLDSAKCESDFIQSERDSLREALQSLEKEFDGALSDVQRLEESVARLHEQEAALTEEVSGLRAEKANFESSLLSLTEEKTTVEKYYAVIKDEASRAAAQILELEAVLEGKASESQLLQRDLANLEEKLRVCTEQLAVVEDKASDAAAEILELEAVVKTGESEKLNLQRDLANMKEEFEVCIKELDVVKSQNKSLLDQLTECREVITSLNTNVASLSDSLESERKICQQLDERCRQECANSADLSQQLQASAERSSSLEAQVAELEVRAETTERQRIEILSQRLEILEELEQTKSQTENLCGMLKVEKEKALVEEASYRKKLEDLQKELHQSELEMCQVTTSLQKRDEQLQCLKEENVSVTKALAEALESLSALERSRADVASDLCTERLIAEGLRNELLHKKEALFNAEVSLKELKGNLEEAVSELRDVSAELTATKSEKCRIKLSAEEAHRSRLCIEDKASKLEAELESARFCNHQQSVELADLQRKKAEVTWYLESELAKFVTISRELEKDNVAFSKISDEAKKECSSLQRSLTEVRSEAEKWRTAYDLLAARVAPFKAQLELYEMEKQFLEEKNQATASELSRLNSRISEMMGHHNHKQKIHYLSKITDERNHYKEECFRLQQQNLKQMAAIQKMELHARRQSRKNTLLLQAKENLPEDD